MRAKLPAEVAEKLIEAAHRKTEHNPRYHFQIGRLLFTKRCCQTRMVHVTRFIARDETLPYSESNKQRYDNSFAVCPICMVAVELLTTLSM